MAEPTEQQKAQRAKDLASEAKSQKAQLRQSKRQLAMVFDLNKCLGCQTCVVACKTLWTRDEGMEYMWWATVNTQPGKGTPRDWEKMGGGFRDEEPRVRQAARPGATSARRGTSTTTRSSSAARATPSTCSRRGDPDWGPNWDEDQGGGQYPNSFYFYLPRICNHCTQPGLPRGLPAQRHLQARGRRHRADQRGALQGLPLLHGGLPLQEDLFQPRRGSSRRSASSATRASRRAWRRRARAQCPGRLRFVGFLDDENGPIYKLVKKWQVALPLHPERGTQPNVYYVPPISPPRFDADGNIDESKPRIPTEYLKYLFGDKVEAALATLKAEMAKTKAGGKSELLDTLIVYEWKSLFGPFTKDPAELEPRKV